MTLEDSIQAFRLRVFAEAGRQGRLADLSATLALAAARLSVELGLPMADSIVLATAKAWNAPLRTQDADFEGVPGARFVAEPRDKRPR